MRDPNKTCKACKNYQHMHDPVEDMPTGECRIVAPVGGAGTRGWPLVVLEDWCPQWDREGGFEFQPDRTCTCSACAWKRPEKEGWDEFEKHVCADHPAENLPATVPE